MLLGSVFTRETLREVKNSDKSTVMVIFDHYILKSGFTRIFENMDEILVSEADTYEAKAFAAFGTFQELGDKELQVKVEKFEVTMSF